MVVVCGTATTIDFLSADGVFKGGMILPGVGLMLRSLHEGTAALPDQDGDFFAYPTQTVDAIASGCQHAQAGAIERLFANEQRVQPDVVCLLSGGAAGAVAPRLTIPFQLHDNLVIEGCTGSRRRWIGDRAWIVPRDQARRRPAAWRCFPRLATASGCAVDVSPTVRRWYACRRLRSACRRGPSSASKRGHRDV